MPEGAIADERGGHLQRHGLDRVCPDRTGSAVPLSLAAQSTEHRHAVPQTNVATLLAWLSFAATQFDSLGPSDAVSGSTRDEFDGLVVGNGRIFLSVAAIGDRVVAAGFSFDGTRNNAELALLAGVRRRDFG